MHGEELRAIRKKLDLHQDELARLLGISTNSVARYERGEVAIPEPTARLVVLLQERKNRKKIARMT